MATLQPGEKARMYALGKLARGGATRGGYVSARAFIAIDGVHVGFGGTPGAGHVGTIITSLTITDALNEAPNTAQFRINGTVPAAGAQIKITLGSKNATGALFAGFALAVQQGYAADKPANINADVSCVDYTWLFGFRKITAHYLSQSASTIAADLVARFAGDNGFTGHAIAPGLPSLDEITFTDEELDQAMTRLAQRIGGYWYVDYLKDVHLFLNETLNGAPEVLTPQHKSLADVRKVADRTQVLTRCYVEGQGSNILGAVAPGDTLIPLEAVDMFVAASDVFAKLSPSGSTGGAQRINFTGVIPGGAGSLVGPGVGPPGAPTLGLGAGTGLGVGRYQYAYTDVTPSGETLPSPIATIDVGAPIPAPASSPGLTALAQIGGVDIGTHYWGYTYITATGRETTLSPLAGVATIAPLAVSGGVQIAEPFTGGGMAVGNYTYKCTYIGNVGGESTVAPYAHYSAYLGAGNGHFRVTIGGSAGMAQVIPAGVQAVNVFRTHVNDAGGLVYFVGQVTVPAGATFVQLDDYNPDSNLQTQPPTTNGASIAAQRVRVTTAPSPATAIVAVNVYRTAANQSSPFRLVARSNGTQGAVTFDDVTPDASLGAAPPNSNTTGADSLAVAVSNMAPGPAPTTGRNMYRTAVNGSQLRLITAWGDNTTTAFLDTRADGLLGANAPVSDTSGLALVPGQVPAGAAAIIVANTGPFEAGGGWAVIGNGEQVIRYRAKTGTTLTGVPPTGIGAIVAAVAYNSTITAAPMITGIPASGTRSIVEALSAGDQAYLVVQRDNTQRQSDLAAMVKAGPGVREEWVQDRRLAIPEARARGDATLALRPLEDVTITYTCRDLRTASGKTITVNLPAPTNLSGSFKIQTVTIANFRPFPNQYPTFSVTASSSQFSFEDWLRQMETKV